MRGLLHSSPHEISASGASVLFELEQHEEIADTSCRQGIMSAVRRAD